MYYWNKSAHVYGLIFSKTGETFIPVKDREITALIAYLQRLGTDIKVKDIINETAQN